MGVTQSDKWHLNRADLESWIHSALVWLAPLGLLYFGSVALSLQDGFSWSDFALTPATQGAIALYVVNQLYGLSKRFAAGK